MTQTLRGRWRSCRLAWLGAVGCLLYVMANSSFGQPADLASMATSPESDEVITRKDQSRLKGRIRFANEATINFKQPGKPVRILSVDEYSIVTWFGVTNAKAVSQATAEKIVVVDQLLRQLSAAEGVESELIEQIQRAQQQFTELRDSIPRFEKRQLIDELPLNTRLGDEHVRILLDSEKGLPRRSAFEGRLKKAGDTHKNIISLRKRLSAIEVELGTRQFDDIQRNCPLIIKEIEERETMLRQKSASTDGFQPFTTALQLVENIAKSLATSKPILARQPALATLDQDLDVLNEIVGRADAQLSALAILGKPVTEGLSTEVQLCQAHVTRFTRYRELTTDLRSNMVNFENLVTKTDAQPTVSESQLASQLAAQESRLKSLVAALKSEQPVDLASIATREANGFIKLAHERTALLLMRKVEIPRITELQRMDPVKTRVDAQQRLAELELRVQRLQQYLDQNRLTSPSDRTDCRNMLQTAKVDMDRLTARMQELDRNETRDEFAKQTALMDGFLRGAVDADLTVLVNDLQQAQLVIEQVEKGYLERLKGVANPVAGADALLRDLSSSKGQTIEVIEFLALRQDLADINSMPEDLTQLAENQDHLSSLKATIWEREAKLPDSLAPLRKATVGEVARLEINLQRTQSTLRFQDAEQSIIDMLSQLKATLEKGDLPAAGFQAYLAASQSESLGAFLQQETWLAQQPGYSERVVDLKTAVKPLGDQLAVAREQERSAAGWEPWLGRKDLILSSPSPEGEWLQIESLQSQQEWSAVERELDSFARRHTDSYWSNRVAQKRAELQLQRGRVYEQQGRLVEARAEYLRTTESPLDHLVVKAAAAAIQNIDEQLRHAQSVEQLDLSIMIAGGFLVAVAIALGTVFWQRSSRSRLHYAAGCLNRARKTRSAKRREALVREAAYVLAQFPAGDPRVAALWSTPTLQRSEQAASKQSTTEASLAPAPSVDLADIVDAALGSQAAPELIAAQCLAWLKSNQTRSRIQRRRNREVREWLVCHLEPQESDSNKRLEAKVGTLLEYEDAVNPREVWTKRYCLRAYYQLGQFAEALKVAKAMSRERLPGPQLEEWVRLTASCYLQSEQWNAAEKFLRSVTKRKLQILELPEWLRTAQAGIAGSQ
ncbi:MAG: hypothetical protein AABP62_27400 [Planctomycetota bacterium]